VQKEKDYVQVKFACNCMTFDGSNNKKWHTGEYRALNAESYEACKVAHDAQCSFDKELEVSV